MKTKLLMMVGVLFIATHAQAARADVLADGFVTYKHPNGELVNRECSLSVPAMGVGQVKLKCGVHEMITSEFDTTRRHGRIIFSVIFRDIDGAPEGSASKYRGSYLRGSNQAIYYGDVYSSSDASAGLVGDTAWQYTGGFMFSKDIVARPVETR